MCSAYGLSGLLGATKRRILSFAEAPFGAGESDAVPLVVAAEGMIGRGIEYKLVMIEAFTKVRPQDHEGRSSPKKLFGGEGGGGLSFGYGVECRLWN